MELEKFHVGLAKSTYLAIAAISVIIVASGWAAFGLTSNNQMHSTTVSPPAVVISNSVSSSKQSESASSTASNGIMLNVRINPVNVASGGIVTMNDEAFNTLTNANNVSGTANWAFSSLIPACHTGIFNDALYSGYYTSANISSANSLLLYGPGGIPCPLGSGFSYYIFSPDSENATAFSNPTARVSSTQYAAQTAVSCSLFDNSTIVSGTSTTVTAESSACISSTYVESQSTTEVTATIGELPFRATGEFYLGQYWDQNTSSLTYFAPGQYSLIVGDIWGSYVILHFQVI